MKEEETQKLLMKFKTKLIRKKSLCQLIHRVEQQTSGIIVAVVIKMLL
jgi:23S rRNA-/tRNA-specific pseudouridylate synthase